MKTIRDWVKDIHGTAVEKGWYLGERPFGELIVLAVGEVSEAVEEVRKSRPPYYRLSYDAVIKPGSELWDMADPKPEGEAIELADTVIRLFDLAGSLGWELEDVGVATFGEVTEILKEGAVFLTDQDLSHPLGPHMRFCELLCDTNTAYSGAVAEDLTPSEVAESFLCGVVLHIADYFYRRGWDLEKMIEAKYEYNKTRPFRHGNKAH